MEIRDWRKGRKGNGKLEDRRQKREQGGQREAREGGGGVGKDTKGYREKMRYGPVGRVGNKGKGKKKLSGRTSVVYPDRFLFRIRIQIRIHETRHNDSTHLLNSELFSRTFICV